EIDEINKTTPGGAPTPEIPTPVATTGQPTEPFVGPPAPDVVGPPAPDAANPTGAPTPAPTETPTAGGATGATPAPVAPTAPTAGDPAAAKAYITQGDAAFAKKDYDNAANDYKLAADADPADRDSRYRLGVTLAVAGDLPGAINAWESVLLLEPT